MASKRSSSGVSSVSCVQAWLIAYCGMMVSASVVYIVNMANLLMINNNNEKMNQVNKDHMLIQCSLRLIASGLSIVLGVWTGWTVWTKSFCSLVACLPLLLVRLGLIFYESITTYNLFDKTVWTIGNYFLWTKVCLVIMIAFDIIAILFICRLAYQTRLRKHSPLDENEMSMTS